MQTIFGDKEVRRLAFQFITGGSSPSLLEPMVALGTGAGSSLFRGHSRIAKQKEGVGETLALATAGAGNTPQQGQKTFQLIRKGWGACVSQLEMVQRVASRFQTSCGCVRKLLPAGSCACLSVVSRTPSLSHGRGDCCEDEKCSKGRCQNMTSHSTFGLPSSVGDFMSGGCTSQGSNRRVWHGTPLGKTSVLRRQFGDICLSRTTLLHSVSRLLRSECLRQNQGMQTTSWKTLVSHGC